MSASGWTSSREPTRPALACQEFVGHLYAPVHGPHAASTYSFLRHVWTDLRQRIGMDGPIAAFGVADLPPPTLGKPDMSGVSPGLLAAQESDRPGVFQAVLRREHDVFCLSAMLAPPGDTGSWVDLDRCWTRVCGQFPDGLLGTARLYLARLTEGGCRPVVAESALARACRGQLPCAPATDSFDNHGVTTTGGMAVWEFGAGEDTRLERRIVVVAGADCDAELSAWTWSRGDEALTPLPRYLLQAAKLRYHLRVWAGGEPLRDLRRQLDTAVDRLDDALAATDPGLEPGDGKVSVAEDSLHRMDVAASRLARATADLEDLRRSVEIAAANMAAYANLDVLPTAFRGLYADDRDLAAWFIHQLRDDAGYMEAARGRADAIGRLGRTVLARHPHPSGHPGQQQASAWPGPARDITLATQDRSTLVRALAQAFRTDAAADIVLTAIGYPPERRHSINQSTPELAWTQTLRELDNGLIATPYRLLLLAALDRFPHNSTFYALALRYRLLRASS